MTSNQRKIRLTENNILYILNIHNNKTQKQQETEHRLPHVKENRMDIIISNSLGIPIYEQIKEQIKRQIMAGDLKEGEMLPSMRVLAKELQISIITTKRAYEDLEREGFITSVTGKGSFVRGMDPALVKENMMFAVQELLEEAVKKAELGKISQEELTEMLQLLYEDRHTQE